MKTYRSFLLAAAVLLGFGASVLPAQSAGESLYEIRGVKREKKAKAHVDNGWKDGAPCIGMDIRVTSQASGKPYARAYFFDKDNKALAKVNEPSMVTDTGDNYVSMPASFAPKKWAPISFAIPQVAERWSRVVVVFGDKTQVAAEVYPSGDINTFDFAEKALVSKPAKK
jgi:hypothetical protein